MEDPGGGGVDSAAPKKMVTSNCPPTHFDLELTESAGTAAARVIPEGSNEEKEVIKENYKKMYSDPSGDLARAEKLGYGERFIKLLPECLHKSFYGSANPWNLGDPAADSLVVDFGSGLGIDCAIAAKLGAGKVVGLDLTPKAVADATKTMQSLGLIPSLRRDFGKISFREADLETPNLAKKLDLENKVDLITSNGVINLVDVKQKVFNNAFALLKSGGWMRFSDMAMETPLPTNFG